MAFMKQMMRVLGSLLLAIPAMAFAGEAVLWLDTGRDGETGRALLLETDVEIQVTGLVARTEVRQRFFNGADAWAEGRYVFPLPDNAAVDTLTIRAGRQLIVGEIQERTQARATYRQARDRGQRAGLVEQERPNLFTSSVANIAPGEEIEIRIGFNQPIKFEQGRFSLRFPTTIAPRYVPGRPLPPDHQSGNGWSPDTDRVPDASRITPPVQHPDAGPINPLRLSTVLRPGMELSDVSSSYHPITVHRQGDTWHIELEALATISDRDLELIWLPAHPERTHTAVFTERHEAEDYVMLMMLPPHRLERDPPPREMILIIDTSGSMMGEPIIQARESLLFALDRLRPEDRFNIIEFNHITRSLHDDPVAVTPERLEQARRFVKRLRAGGGTVMGPALTQAMRGTPPDNMLRQIVFITDGVIANETEVLDQIRRDIGAARLFNVGIGHGVNSYFLRTGSRHGRGSYTFIADTGQITSRMSELIARLESPAIQDIELDWPVTAEVYPDRLPDLYVGEPLMVVARASKLNGMLTASGRQGDALWRQELSLASHESAPGIARLWGRQRIESLQDVLSNGGDSGSIRAQIIDTALRYQLLSPHTSLVAVDHTPVRPVDETLNDHDMPHNLPHGRKLEGFFSAQPMPATATSKMEKFGLGMTALAVALLLIFGSRWRVTDIEPVAR
jgi:Ca-activated chloride channel homolog